MLPVPLGDVQLGEDKVVSCQLLQLIVHKESMIPESEYQSVVFGAAVFL